MDNNRTQALAPDTILHGEAYDYKIMKVLGQGTFGITYKAKVEMKGALGHLDSNMYVAVKEFFMKEVNGRENSTVTSGTTDSGGLFQYYRGKFEREARNLSQLHHPNIVKVLEAFCANGTTYYAMEYVDGMSLDDLIAKSPQGRLSLAKAIATVKQIGAALAFMHSKQMLHLDVKPGNVMMRGDGTPVLIDFGLSKQYTQGGEPESSTKVGAGTPGYAPLEQASFRDGKDFPTMMDVYALGGTMYKMLTGQRPPDASEILNDGFPADSLLQLGIPEQTVECIAKAMTPMKKDRWQTVDEFVDCLTKQTPVRGASKSGGATARSEEGTRLDDEDVPRNGTGGDGGDVQDDGEEEESWLMRNKVLCVIVALVVVLVVGMFLFNSKGDTAVAVLPESTEVADSVATSADEPDVVEQNQAQDNKPVATPQKEETAQQSPAQQPVKPVPSTQPTKPSATAATSTASSATHATQPESKPSASNNKVHDIVEQQPEFPGGTPALYEYLSKNLRYPSIARENEVQGRVIVIFTVEKDGSLSNITLARSVDPMLDKEAMRLVRGMPKWIPGKRYGEAVRTRYLLPVTFKLQ